MNGQVRPYRMAGYEGNLSIKCMIEGAATWETRGGRFVVDVRTFLVLNEGRRYSLTVDADAAIETFCPRERLLVVVLAVREHPEPYHGRGEVHAFGARDRLDRPGQRREQRPGRGGIPSLQREVDPHDLDRSRVARQLRLYAHQRVGASARSICALRPRQIAALQV